MTPMLDGITCAVQVYGLCEFLTACVSEGDYCSENKLYEEEDGLNSLQ